MTVGLIGRKLGMTRLFAEDGSVVPVSVISAAPNLVTRIRSVERDGYAAVQVGAGSARRLTKPVAGQLPKMDKDAPKPAVMREFRVDSTDGYEPGQALDVTLFEAGDLVDVTGTSKGRGFAGTVKRHHFHRGPVTHGSTNTRQPGSIGAGTTPGRVFKNTKMSGHMGDERITVQKLQVFRVDAERQLLLVRGAVPGARNGLVVIRKASA
ncbi:MAG TPA: 50S ribosomal protein L3 [Candidatus Limnocylindria bacterium]|nr:50S ribosomal protein L3 [Candidatus Limnocylindria bacterium]